MTDPTIETLKTQADIELRKIEAQSNAKEVASKYIGKTAIPWIVLLVIVGVVASAFLSPESLPAVIGLVSTATMAMIAMLTGITGTKDKEDKPEIQIIRDLINKIDTAPIPTNVDVDKDQVTVTKGSETITAKR